ncbi:MAG TPA: AsmA-like C-terminal region-containing protein [Xanthobacteraceae bacterium]|nr:AsmA-like C-terminal region-containing protein [Xanthobacteraceae bacterium]
MQHTLLGLAIAFILAIAAALAAPAVVDWNDWRAEFERHASTLTGAPVRIRGRIEATLLPTPAFVFRDVQVGNPESGSGARIGEVQGVLSLGALLRGHLEAETFALIDPEMRIADTGQGSLLQAARTAAAAAGVVTLARIGIARGSLTIDRAGGPLVLDDIYADGDMRSRQGPIKFDSVFRHEGRRFGLKVSTSQFSADGTGRVRATLDHAGVGRSFDADGQIFLSGSAPRFEGKLIATHRPPVTAADGTPWQLTANTKASEARVELEALQLSFGKDAAATDLAGKLEFEPWPGGKIDGTLSARRLDLDLAAGSDASKGLPAAIAPLQEMVALFDGLPLRGRISLASEAVAAAGGTMRDVRAAFRLRENALALEHFEAASLPGRGKIVASGGQTGGPRFSGRASVQAEDGGALLRWAFGAGAAALKDTGSLRLTARVEWRDGQTRLDELEFSLAEATLGGSVAFVPAAGKQQARIEAALTANGADLDLLQPLAQWARAESAGADLELKFAGSSLRLLERPLKRVDLDLSRDSEGLAINQLAVEDFDGLSVTANGRIAAPVERPSGTIQFELATTRPDGMAAIVHEYLGAEPARLARYVAGSGNAMKLSGKATGAGSAAGIEVNATGTLGDFDATVAASVDLLTDQLSEGHIALEARNPGSLAVLFGLSPGLPSAGSGALEIDLSKPEKGVLPLVARLTAPGTEVAANGTLAVNGEGRIEPSFNVKVTASDLRPLIAPAAQASGHTALGAQGGWRFGRDTNGFRFDDIALQIGDTKLTGALTASALLRPVIGGKLTATEMNVATLLAASVGQARGGIGYWPTVRFGPAPLSDVTGVVEMNVDHLGLPGGLAATKSKFRLRLAPNSVAIEEFSGDYAGGKLAGHANFVRGRSVAFDGRASLKGFDIASVLVADEKKSEMRGRGTMTLSVAGSGVTPAAIAASLAGQGTLAIEGLEIDRADPGAVGAVFAAEEKSEPRDEIAVIAALSPALAEGSLRISKIEAPIVVAGGNARIVSARADVGTAQVSAEGNFDIAKLTLDASLELEIEAAAMRPGATIRWSGPVGSIERGIEAAALANAITLRAMERETKRIEERDRALPPLQPRAEEPRAPNPVAVAPPLTPPNPAAPPISVMPSPQARPKVSEPRYALPPLPPALDIKPLPPVYRPESN